uniref:Uncharacterized protein n=1 Tax=Phyllostachys edulis TaxID=38705 RepID=D3IVQ7_PHYED|nr:hypothetical protein [Phyllostachys edulis]
MNDQHGQINMIGSASCYKPSYATPYVTRTEVTPYAFSAPYATRNVYDSALYVINDYGRIDGNSASVQVPPYNTIAYSVSPTPPQSSGIPHSSWPEGYFSVPQQDAPYVQPTTSYSFDIPKPYTVSSERQVDSASTRLAAEQDIGSKNFGWQFDEEKWRASLEVIATEVRKDVRERLNAYSRNKKTESILEKEKPAVIERKEQRSATVELSASIEEKEEVLPTVVAKVSKNEISVIGSDVNNNLCAEAVNSSLAIVAAEQNSACSESIVSKTANLAMRKIKNSRSSMLEIKKVFVLPSEFRAKTTEDQFEKGRQEELPTTGDVVGNGTIARQIGAAIVVADHSSGSTSQKSEWPNKHLSSSGLSYDTLTTATVADYGHDLGSRCRTHAIEETEHNTCSVGEEFSEKRNSRTKTSTKTELSCDSVADHTSEGKNSVLAELKVNLIIDSRTTIEHVGQFIVRCREAGSGQIKAKDSVQASIARTAQKTKTKVIFQQTLAKYENKKADQHGFHQTKGSKKQPQGGHVLMTRFGIYNGRYNADWSDDKDLKLLLIQLISVLNRKAEWPKRPPGVLDDLFEDLLGGPDFKNDLFKIRKTTLLQCWKTALLGDHLATMLEDHLAIVLEDHLATVLEDLLATVPR